MRVAYAIVSSLLLLGGRARAIRRRSSHSRQAAEGRAMQNCPMMSAPADGQPRQGAMMGDHAGQTAHQGQMMQGQMMQDMHPGDMSNCPMAQGVSPPAPPLADPHQH